MLITAYESGELSLGKAAELLGLATEEMKELLIANGVQIHLGPQDADELREELSAFKSA